MGGGGLDLGFPQETDKSVFLEKANFMDVKNQFANKARTDDTTDLTAEAGYKTSIDQSDMCSCSFAEENRQNVGCASSSRGLNVDEFLIRLIKYELSIFLTACKLIFLALLLHERRKLTFSWEMAHYETYETPFNSRNATHFLYL